MPYCRTDTTNLYIKLLVNHKKYSSSRGLKSPTGHRLSNLGIKWVTKLGSTVHALMSQLPSAFTVLKYVAML